MKILDMKYSMSVILSIHDAGQCLKKDLLKIVKSPSTLNDLLDELKESGLIQMVEEMKGRRTYTITLTAKGKSVAKKLKELDSLAS